MSVVTTEASTTGPHEVWAALPGDVPSRVVVVLDASQSARPCREAICRFARGLLAALPGEHLGGVYCLGNATPLPPTTLATADLGAWCGANEGRASLLGPVFEHLAERAASVVVLAAGTIFDLDDWLDTPLGQRSRFVSFDNVPLTTDERCRAEEGASLPPAQLARDLDCRVTRVDLAGTDLMPFAWDNPAYSWDVQGHCLSAGTPDNLRVRVGLLASRTAVPRPRATLANGSVVDLAWETCAPLVTPAGSRLSAVEAAVFRQCLRDGCFRCPHCGGEHPATRLRCPRSKDTSILGAPIYQGLDDPFGSSGVRGFALLRVGVDHVELVPHRCPNLRLAHDLVVCRSGADLAFYRCDAVTGQWLADRTMSFRPYYPVSHGIFALLL